MQPAQMVQARPELADAMRRSRYTHASMGRQVGKDRTFITKVINQQRECRRDTAVLIAYFLGVDVDAVFTDRPQCPRCGFSAEAQAA